MSLSSTPPPAYYAVIFTSLRTDFDDEGYGEAASWMEKLASRQPGFLGVESARGDDRVGITVSYWRDETSIANWKADIEHTEVRERGRTDWYARYELRVAKVERAYGFVRD